MPIRVGVNAGSLDKDLLEKYGSAVPEALVESALAEIHLLEDIGFHDIKISVKHSNVRTMVESYRLLSTKTEYPLHLGVTEAGPPPAGLMKSVAGIATLLLEGIGDTIRFSLTADPVEEAEAGCRLLEQLGLRERAGLDLIACPSCGPPMSTWWRSPRRRNSPSRRRSFRSRWPSWAASSMDPVAREADIGIAAGKGKGHLFIKGKVVRAVPEADMVAALVDEARRLVAEGVGARLAAADGLAEEMARETANALLSSQGDANHVVEARARWQRSQPGSSSFLLEAGGWILRLPFPHALVRRVHPHSP